MGFFRTAAVSSIFLLNIITKISGQDSLHLFQRKVSQLLQQCSTLGEKKKTRTKSAEKKKDRHKKFLDGGSVMTQDELNRLSELSRKQSAGSPEKLPSGITANYRLLDKDNPDSSSVKMPKKEKSLSSSDKHDSLTRSRPTSLDTPPPLPERPPPKMKKSILKSSQSYDVSRSVSSELDDPHILLKNTKANEMFAYRKSLQ